MSGSASRHRAVLLEEALAALAVRADGVYVDATFGRGGHSRAILALLGPAGRRIAIDRDPDAVAAAREITDPRFSIAHAPFSELAQVLDRQGVAEVQGVLADLGVSSMQLDDAARGFSFRADGPLDMRMDMASGPTVAALLATVDEHELADAIYRFGEERKSRRVARAIVEARDEAPIDTTARLASIVRRAAGGGSYQRIDPATRTFQALRIWVNRELDGLDAFVIDAVRALRQGGRAVIIGVHSREGRVGKHAKRMLRR